jgi:uncharacterized protein YfiM (DUF2279 family)
MKLPTDKFLHFTISSVIAFALSLASPIVGVSFTLGLGLGKEYGDSKAVGNHWDWWDIVADLVGIGVGVGLSFWCETYIK